MADRKPRLRIEIDAEIAELTHFGNEFGIAAGDKTAFAGSQRFGRMHAVDHRKVGCFQPLAAECTRSIDDDLDTGALLKCAPALRILWLAKSGNREYRLGACFGRGFGGDLWRDEPVVGIDVGDYGNVARAQDGGQ